MSKSVIYKILAVTAVLVLAVFFVMRVNRGQKSDLRGTAKNIDAPIQQSSSTSAAPQKPAAELSLPLDGALSRVTKKPFGIKVSPGHSPVSPERFSGYHTGTDFETLPNEQDSDVPVSAVCSGSVRLARWASGYGGVLVQQCKLSGQDVTVVYGHLRLSSIAKKAGEDLNAGEKFAVLGTGYSRETDSERKHLHLGLHKGTGISILGYVQRQQELSAWLDPLKYF